MTRPLSAADVAYFGAGLPASVAFATALQFDQTKRMPRQQVTGPLAFTLNQTSALAGSMTYLSLVADGVNAPAFTGYKEAGQSAGYDNTAGQINKLEVGFDGVDYAFAWHQNFNPVLAPRCTGLAATVGQNTVALTFSKALATSSPPPPSAFTLTNSGGAQAVSGVSISGAVVTLTTSRTLASGDIIAAAYNPPSTNALVSSDGEFAGGFSGQAVTLSGGIPVPVGANSPAGSTTLVITFSQALSGSSVPATTAFAVTNSGGTDTVSGVAVSGTTVTITKSRPTHITDTITVAYTQPSTGKLQDASANLVASFSGLAVTETGGDATAPTLVSAQAVNGGTTIVLTYSEALDTSSTPATSAYAISNSAGAETVSSVAVSGSAVTITKSRTTGSGDTITIAYTVPGSNRVQDIAGNTAAALTSQAVTVTSTTNYLRLNAHVGTGLTETANGDGSYSYGSTVSGYGTGSTSAWGVSAKKLPSGQDGDVYFTVSDPQSVMLGWSTSSAGGDYTTYANAVYSDLAGQAWYVVVTAGAGAQAPTNHQTAAASDILRLDRTGTTVTGSVSKDGGSTWLVIKTWTGQGTGDLYPCIMAGKIASVEIAKPYASSNVV